MIFTLIIFLLSALILGYAYRKELKLNEFWLTSKFKIKKFVSENPILVSVFGFLVILMVIIWGSISLFSNTLKDDIAPATTHTERTNEVMKRLADDGY